eukprot:151156-Rhodomonas_salina.4
MCHAGAGSADLVEKHLRVVVPHYAVAAEVPGEPARFLSEPRTAPQTHSAVCMANALEMQQSMPQQRQRPHMTANAATVRVAEVVDEEGPVVPQREEARHHVDVVAVRGVPSEGRRAHRHDAVRDIRQVQVEPMLLVPPSVLRHRRPQGPGSKTTLSSVPGKE